MSSTISSQVVLVVGCGLLAASCAEKTLPAVSTETGNPFDNSHGGETGSDGCDAVETDLEIAASSALGFSAQAIADLIAGQREETIEWLGVSGLEYGPESGRSGLTLRVEPLKTARAPAPPGGRLPIQHDGRAAGAGSVELVSEEEA